MCGNNFVVARWILGILILAIVFSLGMKLGQLQQQLRYSQGGMMYGGVQAGYGDRGMMGY